MMPSSSGLRGIALARSRLINAPTTYPIRLAAPSYAAWDTANQCSLTRSGISGLKANRDRPMPTRLEHRPAVTAPVILAPEGSQLLFNILGVAASNVRSPQKDPSALLSVQLGFKNLKSGREMVLSDIDICLYDGRSSQ